MSTILDRACAPALRAQRAFLPLAPLPPRGRPVRWVVGLLLVAAIHTRTADASVRAIRLEADRLVRAHRRALPTADYDACAEVLHRLHAAIVALPDGDREPVCALAIRELLTDAEHCADLDRALRDCLWHQAATRAVSAHWTARGAEHEATALRLIAEVGL